jgi:hypothetical protein
LDLRRFPLPGSDLNLADIDDLRAMVRGIRWVLTVGIGTVFIGGMYVQQMRADITTNTRANTEQDQFITATIARRDAQISGILANVAAMQTTMATLVEGLKGQSALMQASLNALTREYDQMSIHDQDQDRRLETIENRLGNAR